MPSRFNVLPQVGENQSPNARMAPVPRGQFDTGQAQHNLQIIQEEKQKISFYDAMDRVTQLKKREMDSRYQEVLGENARELPKRMREEYQKWTAELEDTLTDPRARLMFRRKADENELSFIGNVEQHSLRQKTVSEAQKTDAFVQTWQDAGIKALASGDQAGAEKAANEVDGVWRLHGQTNGIPSIKVDEIIRSSHSKLYAGGIKAMLDSGRDLDAQAAFDKYKDTLTVGERGDRGPVERALEQGSRLGAATRELDRIVSPTFKDIPTGGNNWTREEVPGAQNMGDVLKETAKIKDDKTRHMVNDLARQYFADQRLAVKQKNESAFMAIAKRIEQSPGVDPEQLATPDEWANQITDPDVKASLRELAFPKEEQKRLALTKMVLTPDAELAKYSDAEVLMKFGAGMYEKALDRRNTIRKGGPAYDAIQQHDATLMSVFVKSGLGGVKASDTAEDIKKDPKKQAALYQFWEAVDLARASEQHTTKSKVDDETTRKKAEEIAFFMKQKVKLVRREGIFGAEYLADRALGRKEVAVGDFLGDPEMAGQEIEMDGAFVRELFNFAKARPGTVSQGMDLDTWAEKDRKAINRAYFAFLAQKSPAEVRAAYLGGK